MQGLCLDRGRAWMELPLHSTVLQVWLHSCDLSSQTTEVSTLNASISLPRCPHNILQKTFSRIQRTPQLYLNPLDQRFFHLPNSATL